MKSNKNNLKPKKIKKINDRNALYKKVIQLNTIMSISIMRLLTGKESWLSLVVILTTVQVKDSAASTSPLQKHLPYKGHFLWHFFFSSDCLLSNSLWYIAQSAGAVEYTDSTSAEGYDPPP